MIHLSIIPGRLAPQTRPKPAQVRLESFLLRGKFPTPYTMEPSIRFPVGDTIQPAIRRGDKLARHVEIVTISRGGLAAVSANRAGRVTCSHDSNFPRHDFFSASHTTAI